jgi:hypothetical protein
MGMLIVKAQGCQEKQVMVLVIESSLGYLWEQSLRKGLLTCRVQGFLGEYGPETKIIVVL